MPLILGRKILGHTATYDETGECHGAHPAAGHGPADHSGEKDGAGVLVHLPLLCRQAAGGPGI